MTRIFSTLLCTLLPTAAALAQLASPYGLGRLQNSLLPQNQGMGGISTGIRKLGGYSTVNVSNPASYSSIALTTLDMGATARIQWQNETSITEQDNKTGLSHLVFGIPLNKKSAFSFGLLPYSEINYQSKTSSGTTDLIYTGEGNLSTVYLGYGYSIAPRLSIGANLCYLFGSLNHSKATEVSGDNKAQHLRQFINNHLTGLKIDYGIQYTLNDSKKNKVTVGYSGAWTDQLNSSITLQDSKYTKDFASGDETLVAGSLSSSTEALARWHLPLKHTVGLVFEKNNKLLLGLDLSYSQWKNFRQGKDDPGFNNSFGITTGAQFTPDGSSMSGYFRSVDYRMGFKYENNYANKSNHTLDLYAFTLGFGLPLPANRFTIHKINFAAELGTQGTLTNSLVRENYLKFNLGFALNDKWFIRPKID